MAGIGSECLGQKRISAVAISAFLATRLASAPITAAPCLRPAALAPPLEETAVVALPMGARLRGTVQRGHIRIQRVLPSCGHASICSAFELHVGGDAGAAELLAHVGKQFISWLGEDWYDEFAIHIYGPPFPDLSFCELFSPGTWTSCVDAARTRGNTLRTSTLGGLGDIDAQHLRWSTAFDNGSSACRGMRSVELF